MVEIYINGTKLDTKGDISMSLNYSIADIKEPQDRKQTHSKTISIPSTKINDKLFTHIFEVNREGGYNPNLKADCLILQGSIEQLKGTAQLKNIVEKNLHDRTYEIVCFGELIDLFHEIGKGKLEDLDFSEFDHAWTQGNQQNSWDTSIIQNGSPVAFSYGNGYVYPLIDYGYSSDQITFDVTHMFPSLYLKTIIDKIFTTNGFTYESDFFDSDFFKRLIIPYSRQRFELSESQIQDRMFMAQTTGVSSINMSGVVYGPSNAQTLEYSNDSTGGNFDNGSNYDNSIYEYTVPDDGYYDFVAQAFAGIRLTPVSGAVAVTPTLSTMNIYVRILVNGTPINSSNIQLDLNNVPSFSTLYTSSSSIAQPDPDGIFVGVQSASASNVFVVWATGLNLNQGDVVKVDWFPLVNIQANLTNQGLGINDRFEITSSPGTYMNGDYEALIQTNGTFYNKISNVSIVEGGNVDMNTVLPFKILQKDLLSSIIRAFNLYTQVDKTNPNNYIIEPRDDFYSDGSRVDFSDKLDISQDYTITPVGTIDSGKYLFTYKEDKDFFNQDYLNKYDEIYGEEDIDIQNDFIDKVTETKLIFSASPLADNGFSNLVTTRILQKDSNGGISPIASNIRMLYYGGLKTINNTQWNHSSSVSGTVSSFQYPYAGHLDDPFDPTVDLNFGVIREVYYDDLFTPITWTNNNLYNIYYGKQITEITDPNSIIFTGIFKLSAYDISKIDFRNEYWFKNSYWRLNQIIDYNPSDYSLTKCEFIKVKESQVFIPSDIVDIGAVGSGEYELPKLPSSPQYNSNSYSINPTVKVQGSNNFISKDSQNLNVLGDQNNIHSNTKNISIQGNGNTVLSGLENVSLINTNNVTVTSSNVSYLNGQIIGSGSVEIVTTTTNAGEDVSTYLCDATTAAFTVRLPSSPSDGKTYNIKKTDSTANVVTVLSTGINIDGAASQLLNSQYDNITVQFSEDKNEYMIL